MKIFFMSTHSSQGTGYGRMACKMTNFFADQPGVEVVFYGFQNYPGQQIKDRFIDPRIKFYDAVQIDPDAMKGFGDAGIIPALEAEKPDVLFIYNDLPVTNAILSKIPQELMPPKVYVYLDIVYPWQNIDMYDTLKTFKIDKIFTFAHCWAKHLIDDLGFPKEQVVGVPHGLYVEEFSHVDTKEAKKALGFNEDDYLVVNMNRNTYRKMIPKTIEAFIEFLKMNNMDEKIKLFLGCSKNSDTGCDVFLTCRKVCLQKKVDPVAVLDKHIFITNNPTTMPNEVVNLIYNAGDIGITTTCGEGFGLTNLEHLYLNKPQIVPKIPIYKETMGGYAVMVKPSVYMTMFPTEAHLGDLSICTSKDFAIALDECYKDKLQQPLGEEYVIKNFNLDIMCDKLKQYVL